MLSGQSKILNLTKRIFIYFIAFLTVRIVTVGFNTFAMLK